MALFVFFLWYSLVEDIPELYLVSDFWLDGLITQFDILKTFTLPVDLHRVHVANLGAASSNERCGIAHESGRFDAYVFSTR